jgi:hypothetical protein
VLRKLRQGSERVVGHGRWYRPVLFFRLEPSPREKPDWRNQYCMAWDLRC